MKCRLSKCNARCCYNIPFDKGELDIFADKIVNRVLYTLPLKGALWAFTNENPKLNKCPFLRKDCKCNIYENRPEVCRLFGEIDKLSCRFLKIQQSGRPTTISSEIRFGR